MPLYDGISQRVPLALAEYTAFLNEVTTKRSVTDGAEGEAYQKILDILGGSLESLTGGLKLINQFKSSLTSMSSSLQEQVTSILANPSGWFTLTFTDQSTTTLSESTSTTIVISE